MTHFVCNCGGELKVQQTVSSPDAVWRRRKCLVCGFLFTTKEEAVDGYIPKELTQRGGYKPEEDTSDTRR